MARYIDAELLEKEAKCLYSINNFEPVKAYTQEQIDNAPTAEVKEVVRGYWIRFSGDEFCCSNCGKVKHYYTLDGVDPDDFCPTCGADMREAAQE